MAARWAGGVTPNRERLDYDWLVIGSGFGGSVSALRLTEKGYRVAVLEAGRQFDDTDFATKASDARRHFWLPFIGMRGIWRTTLFKDVIVMSGVGVGGGSLGYANTLYRAGPQFAKNAQWCHLADWDTELAGHYSTAERMLGITTYDVDTPADRLLREFAVENGFGDTHAKAPIGVFLGTPGVVQPDPYFGGQGPERAGCIRCGSCLLGCRHNAKNTLVKNYLWFAKRHGAAVLPDRTVVDVKPIGNNDGTTGYAVTTVRTGAWLRRDRRTTTAQSVVVAAGALGTNRLLLRCKLAGSLPHISDRLGKLVRTNNETILAVTAPDDANDFANSVALTCSVYPDPDTHIEPVTYGRNADSQSLLFSLATVAGSRGTRPAHFALNVFRHPVKFARSLRIRHWSRRTIVLICMQTLENSISFRVRFRLPNGYPVLTTEQDRNNPNPGSIPAAHDAAEWLSRKLNGIVQTGIPDAVMSVPTTAHLLGGAVIGESASTGVVNHRHEVFGYHGLLVCDGAAMPANVGVNPSLTIAAMAERAMSFINPKV